MKTRVSILAVLAIVCAIGAVKADATAPASDRLAASGLYVQEFWMGGRPGYWIGNASTEPVTIVLTGCRAATKSHPTITELNIGPLTVPPGGAQSVNAGDFVGLGDVLVRDSNNLVLGVLYPPKAPPAASVSQGNVIHLCAALNSIAPANPTLWFELSDVPQQGAQTFEAQLKINGPQLGFIIIRNSTSKAFAASRIVTVTGAGLPVKKATNGDWYIDARRAANPPLQTVLIDYDIPAVKQPSLVLIDATLVNTKRVLMALTRAVLIGQSYRAALPAPRVQNRPSVGR